MLFTDERSASLGLLTCIPLFLYLDVTQVQCGVHRRVMSVLGSLRRQAGCPVRQRGAIAMLFMASAATHELPEIICLHSTFPAQQALRNPMAFLLSLDSRLQPIDVLRKDRGEAFIRCLRRQCKSSSFLAAYSADLGDIYLTPNKCEPPT